MNTLQLKFNLIVKLIALSDTDLLREIDKLLAKIQIKSSEKFKLTSKQVEMLKASEEDIKYGRVTIQNNKNSPQRH